MADALCWYDAAGSLLEQAVFESQRWPERCCSA